MLKLILSGCLVLALVSAQMRTKKEIDDYRSFLYETQEETETTLEEAMAINPKASPWENSGKYQGDILLTDEQIETLVEDYAGNSTADNGRNGMINTNYRWPDRTIIYEIAPNTFNQAQLNLIYFSLNGFHERTCVRWQRRTNQRDYVFITGRNTGCYAHVGYRRNMGRHTLNLAPYCFIMTIVFHEMLHSAGFWHMHQTYNRYHYVRVNWNNIAERSRRNWYLHSNRVATNLGLPYELGSVMHYSAYAGSINGRSTMDALRGNNRDMGHMRYVTGWDIWRLARLYNCPRAWSVEVDPKEENLPYTDPIFDQKLKEAAAKEEYLFKETD